MRLGIEKKVEVQEGHSQVITSADDPVLARDESARPHRDVRQLERLDGCLCLVAPYVDMAAVERREDPWLVPGDMSASSTTILGPVPFFPPRSFPWVLVGSYLGRMEVDALYTLAPGTAQRGSCQCQSPSAIVMRLSVWGMRRAHRTVHTYKSCLCAFKNALLVAIRRCFAGATRMQGGEDAVTIAVGPRAPVDNRGQLGLSRAGGSLAAGLGRTGMSPRVAWDKSAPSRPTSSLATVSVTQTRK